jgi:hypothetical protein
VPGKPGYFAIGDIVRPHLLTTAIGQASIAAESIDHYLKNEELKSRPKVDVHHFEPAGAKLRETGTPLEFPGARKRSSRKKVSRRSIWVCAVPLSRVRSAQLRGPLLQRDHPADELFLGHFKEDAAQQA